jgi:hypothetical protein
MKVALLVCGQMRNITMCVKNWEEYLFPYYDCDIYVATQDANSIKGRICVNPIVVNQYVFQPVTYNIEKQLLELFGVKLKNVNNRRGKYKEYIQNQQEDFILKNALGWAENFLDMKIALNMLTKNYPLIIKIRPDICLCKPFFNIENPEYNSIYVNDKRENFVWDAVFAMDTKLAKKMGSFYDYYISRANRSLSNCFKDWDGNLNAESLLLNFLKENNANIINMGDVGYPITWLIGDIKNNFEWSKRQLKFNNKWKNIINEYTNKYISCYFDICNANAKLPFYLSFKNIKNKKYKIALIICGQSRYYKFCLQNIKEYIWDLYDCDVYVVTQDCISIKPRLGKGLGNQYLITKYNPEQEYYENLFGDTLKYFHIRKTYDNIIKHQKSNFCLENYFGWLDQFDDLKLCLEKSLENQYDFFIKVRPDILLTKNLVLNFEKLVNNKMLLTNTSYKSCSEILYVMNSKHAKLMIDFGSYYLSNLLITPTLSTEEQLANYLNINNIFREKLYCDAYSLQWLVSDIRNNEFKKRHVNLSANWTKLALEYINNFRQVIFDITI